MKGWPHSSLIPPVTLHGSPFLQGVGIVKAVNVQLLFEPAAPRFRRLLL